MWTMFILLGACQCARNCTDAPFENCVVAAELWNPFATNRSLMEMLHAVDRMIDAPFFRTSAAAIPSRIRLPSDLIEDSDAYRLRIDMPGLSKEEVSINFRCFVLTECSSLQLLRNK